MTRDKIRPDDDDDTEGHARRRAAAEASDEVEGHMPFRKADAETTEDDDEVEGHRVEPPRDQA